MHRNTWKQGEARIAKLFNTTRTPLSGICSRHTSSDTLHPNLYIEIKHRKELPLLVEFRKEWEKCVENSKKESKTPLFVIIKKYSNEPLVLLKLKDIPVVAKYMSISD